MASSVSAGAEANEADPWLGRDKYLHGSVSAALALGGYAGASLFTEKTEWRLLSAGAFALSIGAGKEFADAAGAGDASWRDFSWDVLGTASGLAIGWLLDTYVF